MIVVPIDRWPDDVELDDRRSPFRKSNGQGWMTSGVNWSDTTARLGLEMRSLDAENIVLQMAVRDRDIRIDGWIQANARPEHPGVILTFDSKHGPLSYPCGAFDEWQSNLRAIVIALESLRRVDRYGVSGRGQQYTGWKQLPGAGETGTTMTSRAAAQVLVDFEGLDRDPAPSKRCEALASRGTDGGPASCSTSRTKKRRYQRTDG